MTCMKTHIQHNLTGKEITQPMILQVISGIQAEAEAGQKAKEEAKVLATEEAAEVRKEKEKEKVSVKERISLILPD